VERAERDDEQQGRWLLAHLLDWHRREAKASWWEFFRLRDLSEDELFGEKAALAGLKFVAHFGGTTKSPIDRYSYPRQETEVNGGDELHLPDGTSFGMVETSPALLQLCSHPRGLQPCPAFEFHSAAAGE
jgi:hypothetical protein